MGRFAFIYKNILFIWDNKDNFISNFSKFVKIKK